MAEAFRDIFDLWFGGVATLFPASTEGALIIAGVDRTEWIKANSGNFRRQFNARSSFNAILEDQGRGYVPVVGSELIVLLGSVRLFGGFITSSKEYRHPTVASENVMQYTIEATDFNLIADKRLVYYVGLLGVVSFGPGFAGDLMTAICDHALSGDGVDSSSLVEEGPFLAEITAFFETAAAVFNKITQQTGFRWRINEYRQLVFSDFGVTAAPFSITSTSNNWRNLTVTHDLKNYRNRQFVRTETNLDATKTEYFSGDGTTRDFFIGFVDPVSTNPTRFFMQLPEISVDGVVQNVGRIGYDDPADFDVMYDSPTGPGTMGGVGIHFISPQTAPPTGVDNIVVTYVYASGNVVSSEDAAQIAARQAIEGGSGIWENMDEQRNVRDFGTLGLIASGDLDMYAMVPNKLEYETDEQGLVPGDLQTVNLPFHGLNTDLLVESIDTSWVTGSPFQFRHRVVCTDLGPMAGAERLLEKLAEVARIGVPRASGALTDISGDGGGTPTPPALGGRESSGALGNYLEGALNTNDSLSGSSGPFTVSCWIRVDNLSQTGKTMFVFRALFNSPRWGIDFVGGAARFFAVAYTGTDPGAGATITISDTDWHHVAWRKSGAGTSTWDYFLDGVRTSINTSINFTLGGNTFYARMFRFTAGTEFEGALAHMSIWNQSLTDDDLLQLAAGFRSDDVHPAGLIQYWPIAGTADPEPNDATAGASGKPTLAVNGTLPAA